MFRNRKIIFVLFLLMLAAPSWVFAEDKPTPPTQTETKQKAPVASKSVKEQKPPVFVVEGSEEKKELIKLIDEDNAASEIALDAAWGDHNPFDGKAAAALPDYVPPPKVEPQVDSKNFVLGGILWSGDQPSAIINNNVVWINFTILGMTIKEIKENAVVLSNGTQQMVLSLHK